MPVAIQPRAQAAVDMAGKTAEWAKQKFQHMAGIVVPEELPTPARPRNLSPTWSDPSTECDGEDIFPSIETIPTYNKENIEAGVADAMESRFSKPLSESTTSTEPGPSQHRKARTRGNRQDNDVDNIAVRQSKTNTWRRDVSPTDQERRELEKERQAKRQIARDEEENQVMENITNMFVPTLQLLEPRHIDGTMMHSSDYFDERGFSAQPVTGVSRASRAELAKHPLNTLVRPNRLQPDWKPLERNDASTDDESKSTDNRCRPKD